MVQRAARAGVTPPSAIFSSDGETEHLGRDWVILKDCRLGQPVRGGDWPTVLMHRAHGVAVLDILPSDTPDAVEAVRARLEAARFPAIFAGHLPVVRLRVAPRQVALLPSLLNDAFAEQPPLRLPGGDAWVGVAARALRAEQPVPRLGSQRRAGGGEVRAGRRPRRAAAAALRKTAAVLLCLAALGGVVGFVLNGALAPVPAPEAAPAGAVPPPASQAPPAVAVPSPPAPDAGVRAPAPPVLVPPVPGPVPVPPPTPAPPPRSGFAAPVEPAPDASPPTPPALPSVEVPPLPPLLRPAAPAPARRPEAAAPPAPPAPPAARRAPDRPAPERPAPERAAPRRQPGGAGTTRPAADGDAAAPRMPENPPDRCRRVSGSIGSGAPLAEADMRFFNENCIRW